jgi:hypothetical protein
MSMYTQLLDAAFRQRPPAEPGAAERVAVDELHRARTELSKVDQEGADAEAVPVLLALEIGYDIALLEVAQRNGIQSDPSRFEQPQQERERLEGALRERGISLEVSSDGG